MEKERSFEKIRQKIFEQEKIPMHLVTSGFEDRGDEWVALESRGDHKRGDKITLKSGDMVVGDRGLHFLTDGNAIAVKVIEPGGDDEESEPEYPDSANRAKKKDTTDARLLGPLRYDHKGKRWFNFVDAVKTMSEEEQADFPLEGGRTVQWLCDYTLTHGGSFDGRHTRWCLEQSVNVDSVGAKMHDLLGLALELGVCYDQVDASNLACLEVISRTYQLVEETSGSLALEGFEHFVGRDTGAGLRRGIALAPTLAKHAVSRQADETAILKERRKAREENNAASNKNKNPGGGNPPKKP